MKKFKNKVASQDDFVPLTGGNIAQCISTGYRLYLYEEEIAKYEAIIQQLEVRNKYLSGLIQGYDSSIAELKIEGATEMVIMFVKNNPRAIGKAFLIDQLNNYKARLNEVNHQQ